MSLNGPIQLARKTQAAWAAQNPTLLAGQLAISLDATIPNDFKVGPGVWSDLPYVLQALANLKANVVHTHVAADITDLNTVIASAIAAVVDSSPASLDTLNELAAALGDDPNFATTVLNQLALKVPISAIVDNLLSPVGDVPLSANQGKVLKSLIDGNTTSIAAKANKKLTIRTATGSTTLVLADESNMVRMNSASANTLTVPPNSSVAFEEGTQIVISQAGAGQTQVVAGSGVTVNSSGGKMKLTGQYSGATLIKVTPPPGDAANNNYWTLFGDLTT